MKLVTFKHGDRIGFGMVVGSAVIDLTDRFPAVHGVKDLLSGNHLDQLRAAPPLEPALSLDQITLLPPIPEPGKILCIGLNYTTHVAEAKQDAPPPHPIVFIRFSDTQVGHGSPMVRPAVSERFDFEGELAVVIGKPGRHIQAAAAYDHVAGYMCFNDGSVRDWQRHSSQWGPGKNFPASGGAGPWLTTRDEVPDLSQCELKTTLNGEVMQRASVGDLLFDVPALIAYCSTFTPLATGDLIVTGTTGGVGVARTPQVWMKGGDVVTVSVSGVGELTNPIVDEAPA